MTINYEVIDRSNIVSKKYRSVLIVLARVLDLELLVAPKKSIPDIKSIIRSSQGISDEGEVMSPVYPLEEDDDD